MGIASKTVLIEQLQRNAENIKQVREAGEQLRVASSVPDAGSEPVTPGQTVAGQSFGGQSQR